MSDEYKIAGKASESVLVGGLLGVALGICGLLGGMAFGAWIAPIAVKQSSPRVYVVQSGFVEVRP